MHRPIAASLFVASCLTSVCLAADPAIPPSLRAEPITRGKAAEILANTDQIGEGFAKQLANTRDNRLATRLDDVREVMAHQSEWRWYSRDHGILLAIPVRERLGIGTRIEGENAIADVVRRLINQQGMGNPPVQVVFIEPEIPCPSPRYHAASMAYAAGGSWTSDAAACDCR